MGHFKVFFIRYSQNYRNFPPRLVITEVITILKLKLQFTDLGLSNPNITDVYTIGRGW